jgi:DNA-binding response OmpR family regulator
LRVLVADNKEDQVITLASLLTLLGHEVQTATTNEAARRIIEVTPPDAALLDIGLCRTDGFGLVKALSAIGNKPLLIALTGFHNAEKTAKELGFDHFFLKPYDAIAVNQILEAHRQRKSQPVHA